MRSRTLLTTLLAVMVTSTSASAQVLSVPSRWCVIADDPNGNGRFDAGEQGAPAFTNPGQVGEVDADNVLWRRHERPSDAVFIPEAQVTFRSSIYNIVEDPILRFPIIPDPDPNPTGDAFWLYGDILSQGGTPSAEWNLAHNACVTAWRDQHGVEDIGIVVLNANAYRTLTGDSEPGAAVVGGRRVVLRDNAYVLPGSPLNTFPVSDHVDKHFGHEVGHALGGLQHTCSDQNIMSNRRLDPNNDGLVDNIHLSTSIAQVTSPGGDGVQCTGDDATSTVNQVQLIRSAAQATPGCKIAGTNTDCTVLSDVRTDRVRDAPVPFLDLSMFVATNEGATTKLVHEPMGPVDRRWFARLTHYVDYYTLIDQDNNAATGGSAGALSIPISFDGAELVTRVRVGISDVGFQFTPTVWRFAAGSFQQVVDRRIRAFAFPLTAATETRTIRLTDQITLEMPTAIFGAGIVSFRVQAGVVTTRADTVTVVDLLDEDRVRPGRGFRWRSPTFPVCSVLPGTAPRLGAITVNSTGLLPNRPVHLIFGDRHIANGHAVADGSVSISTAIPAGARDGMHLITVGTDGTALTADCIATVEGGPRPPGGGSGGSDVGPFEYAAKIVCGVQPRGSDLRLARGAYRTTVNIRNPGPDSTTIVKELVLAYPPGGQRPGKAYRVAEDRLLAGQGLAADCEDLARRVFAGRFPASYIDGYLVIRSPHSLNVTTVHTAAELTSAGEPGSVRSIDVETVAERRARRSIER